MITVKRANRRRTITVGKARVEQTEVKVSDNDELKNKMSHLLYLTEILIDELKFGIGMGPKMKPCGSYPFWSSPI